MWGWIAGGVAALVALTLSNRKKECMDCPTTLPPPPPPFDVVPARAMTADEALAWLHDAQARQLITMMPAHLADRVTMQPTVAGVTFQYLGHDRAVNDVDPRFAVFLVRLAQRLSGLFGATKLGHLGIYPGNPAHPNDVHNQGRAMDFSSLTVGDGSTVDVFSNWGQKPAPYNIATATATSYRLTPADPGYEIFKAIYTFAGEQGADSTDKYVAQEPMTTIGDHSFIVTPDHPTPDLRRVHQNHMHVQIGPTRV